MKYLFSFVLAGILAVSVAEPASAKKFGSGGFGKVFKTSPYQKQTPASPSKGAKSPEKGKSARPGMGLMGGLLAGGMFAYLLGNGAFEGLQMMDIILFALIGFILFKLFARPKQTPQMAGMQRSEFDSMNSPTSAFEPQRASSAESIPLEFPSGFDVKDFEKGALEHFALVHKAWDEGEFSTIAEYVHPDLLTQLKQQRAQYAAKLDNQIVDLSAEIVRAERLPQGHRLSILFRGLMKDMQENEEHGVFDVWHLEKHASNAWLIVGIEAE
jgi:predicted lipid-binding transport protein (Tim44 family)